MCRWARQLAPQDGVELALWFCLVIVLALGAVATYNTFCGS